MNSKAAGLLKQVQDILTKFGGEKYIPLDHEYWALKNQYRMAEQEPDDVAPVDEKQDVRQAGNYTDFLSPEGLDLLKE